MNKICKIANDKIKLKLQNGDEHMIKKIAWNTFKNTGDINTFMEFKQIEDIENNIREIEDIQKITNMNVNNIDVKNINVKIIFYLLLSD